MVVTTTRLVIGPCLVVRAFDVEGSSSSEDFASFSLDDDFESTSWSLRDDPIVTVDFGAVTVVTAGTDFSSVGVEGELWSDTDGDEEVVDESCESFGITRVFIPDKAMSS